MLRVSYLLCSPISCAFVINCLSREFSLPKFELLISGEQMSCANFFCEIFNTFYIKKKGFFSMQQKNVMKKSWCDSLRGLWHKSTTGWDVVDNNFWKARIIRGVDETIFTSKGSISIIVCKPKLWDNLAHTYWAMIAKYGWYDHEKPTKHRCIMIEQRLKRSALCSYMAKSGPCKRDWLHIQDALTLKYCDMLFNCSFNIYLSSAYVCSQVIMRGQQQNISMLRSKQELNKCVES